MKYKSSGECAIGVQSEVNSKISLENQEDTRGWLIYIGHTVKGKTSNLCRLLLTLIILQGEEFFASVVNIEWFGF